MMHRNRRFCVAVAASAEELAHKLTTTTWTLCTGFSVEGHPDYLFLNDATSEDGAGEFAVILGGLDATVWTQIESITFSWCEQSRALELIQRTLAGEFNRSGFARPIELHGRLDRLENHGRCRFCA